MTLRKKDLEEQARTEPRILPHKESDTGPAPDRTGPAPDRPRKEALNVRLDVEDRAALEREAERTGISMAGIIRSLVREHLRRPR